MLTQSFAEKITEKIKSSHIFIFFTVMIFLGLVINCFEPYPSFQILFPNLLLMCFLTILLLIKCLNKLLELNKQCKEEHTIECALKIIFGSQSNIIILFSYGVIILIYFICLCKLSFIEFNIMGVYILFLGSSTLGMALVAYETYIRLTVALWKITFDKESLSQKYDIFSPSQTNWLQKLYQFSNLLKNASLFMGLLFVFENTLIFFANYAKLEVYVRDENASFIEQLSSMPLEFWLIWLLVFVAIALAFPILAIIQSANMKKIIHLIRDYYNSTTEKKFEEYHSLNDNENYFLDLYLLMNLLQNTENALNNKYTTHKSDKFFTVLTSIITCFLHLTTLYNLFV